MFDFGTNGTRESRDKERERVLYVCMRVRVCESEALSCFASLSLGLLWWVVRAQILVFG